MYTRGNWSQCQTQHDSSQCHRDRYNRKLYRLIIVSCPNKDNRIFYHAEGRDNVLASQVIPICVKDETSQHHTYGTLAWTFRELIYNNNLYYCNPCPVLALTALTQPIQSLLVLSSPLDNESFLSILYIFISRFLQYVNYLDINRLISSRRVATLRPLRSSDLKFCLL